MDAPVGPRLFRRRTGTPPIAPVFQSEHGASGLLTINRISAKTDLDGFLGSITLAVDPDASQEPVGMRGPGFPPG
jgi:hypothetical protein